MNLTFIDRNGPPEAMLCPAFLCDVCKEPVSGGGWVLWNTSYAEGDNRPRIRDLVVVHSGACGRQRQDLNSSRELDQFVQDLAYTSTHAWEPEADVEYVAPYPSEWRLGSR
jgi:hypothetical protein